MTSATRIPRFLAWLVGLALVTAGCSGGLPGASTTGTPTAAAATPTPTAAAEATAPTDVACTIVTEAEVESRAPYGYPRVRTEVSDPPIQCTYYFDGDHVGALVGVAVNSFTSVAELDGHVDGILTQIETDYEVQREAVPSLGDEAWFCPSTDFQANLFVRVGLRLLTILPGAGQAAAISMDQGKAYAIALAQLAIPRLP